MALAASPSWYHSLGSVSPAVGAIPASSAVGDPLGLDGILSGLVIDLKGFTGVILTRP